MKKSLEDLTVPELRDLAAANDVAIASDARKDEIIAALKKAKVSAPDDDEEQQPPGPRDKAVGKAAPEAQDVEPPVDPYEDFAEPVTDGSKPIINQVQPHQPVLAIVLDGSNVLTIAEGPDNDHLVFVESGVTQEWLSEVNASRKFAQDKNGQIYYNPSGIAPSDDFKPVDVIALGT